jgi:uncharacterized protein (DUF305 family)
MKKRFALIVMCSCGLLAQSGRVGQADEAWQLLVASMHKMHADMRSVKQSGDSDRDFVQLMLPHHQAAIEMAKTEFLYGKDPEMRRLAQEIVTTQQSEIEVMPHWLDRHPVNQRPHAP